MFRLSSSSSSVQCVVPRSFRRRRQQSSRTKRRARRVKPSSLVFGIFGRASNSCPPLARPSIVCPRIVSSRASSTCFRITTRHACAVPLPRHQSIFFSTASLGGRTPAEATTSSNGRNESKGPSHGVPTISRLGPLRVPFSSPLPPPHLLTRHGFDVPALVAARRPHFVGVDCVHFFRTPIRLFALPPPPPLLSTPTCVSTARRLAPPSQFSPQSPLPHPGRIRACRRSRIVAASTVVPRRLAPPRLTARPLVKPDFSLLWLGACVSDGRPGPSTEPRSTDHTSVRIYVSRRLSSPITPFSRPLPSIPLHQFDENRSEPEQSSFCRSSTLSFSVVLSSSFLLYVCSLSLPSSASLACFFAIHHSPLSFVFRKERTEKSSACREEENEATKEYCRAALPSRRMV